MSKDVVRVLRVIEYVGTRDAVESAVRDSIHGTKVVKPELTINVATLGNYPEMLEGEN